VVVVVAVGITNTGVIINNQIIPNNNNSNSNSFLIPHHNGIIMDHNHGILILSKILKMIKFLFIFLFI
jgi:hypothetical protein